MTEPITPEFLRERSDECERDARQYDAEYPWIAANLRHLARSYRQQAGVMEREMRKENAA